IDLGLGLGLSATARPTGKLAPPDGFAFPFARFPLSVYGSGRTDFEPAAYAEDALNGTVFHVDASTGSDGNTGLSAASRLQSVHAAVTRGNATGAPFTVLVRNSGGGIVPRIHGISA